MKIIERLYQYLEYKRIRPTNFEKEIGLSNGYLSVQKKRLADMGEGVIVKIIENCRDISINWLITGEGEMLRSDSLIYFPPKKEEPAPIYKSDPKDLEIIELQRRQIQLLESVLAQSNLGLGSAHLAGSSTPPLMGIQSRKHK